MYGKDWGEQHIIPKACTRFVFFHDCAFFSSNPLSPKTLCKQRAPHLTLSHCYQPTRQPINNKLKLSNPNQLLKVMELCHHKSCNYRLTAVLAIRDIVTATSTHPDILQKLLPGLIALCSDPVPNVGHKHSAPSCSPSLKAPPITRQQSNPLAPAPQLTVRSASMQPRP